MEMVAKKIQHVIVKHYSKKDLEILNSTNKE